jgi:hypothetical protein
VYSSGTAVSKRFEFIGNVSGLQGHHVPKREKKNGGKTELFSNGTAQIHFINGIEGI